MKCKTMDDYYVWTCDWCDSENRTLWARVAKGELTCGACHRPANFPVSGSAMTGSYRCMASGLC